MFSKKKDTLESRIEAEITRLLEYLEVYDESSPEYLKTLSSIERLSAIRNPEKPISKDAMLTVGANLVGIVMILGHERAGVITSKALGFVSKLKL